MRKILGFGPTLMLLLNLFGSSPARGADKLPSIDDVIAQYTKAVGERELLEKHWALSLRGSLESSNPAESGPLEVLVYGQKLFMQVNEGQLLMGSNAEVFWRHQRDAELLKVPASTIAETVAIFDPSRVLHWKERFPQIAVTGAQKADDHDVYVIETRHGTPSNERLFIDRASGLLVRDEVAAKHEFFTFSDFRIVDGIKIPFVVHQSTPGPAYSYQFSEAKHVNEVDEAIFQPR